MNLKLNLTSQDYKVLIAICLTMVAGMSLNDMLLPSLPAITKDLHTEVSIVQQSLALFFIGQAISIFICGPISDVWGRKRTMSVSLCGALIVSVCLIFINSIEAYLYLKLLQGLGSGVGVALGRVIMVDHFKNKKIVAIASIFSMSALISPIIMPNIGGYIQQMYGWRANFAISCLILGVIIIIFNYLCIETQTNRSKLDIKTIIRNYNRVITDKKFICWTLLNSACVSAYYVYTVISPFLFQNFYKFSPLEYGHISAIIASANIISKSILAATSKKFNYTITNILTSTVTAVIGFYLYIVDASYYETITLLFLFMFTIGFATPIMSTEALIRFDKIRGFAGAVFSTGTLAITSFICNIIGLLPDKGITLLGLTFLVLGLLSVAASVILARLKD